MNTANEKLAVDLRTATVLTSLSRRTLQRYIVAQKLPARKIGRRTIVLMGEIKKFLSKDQPSVRTRRVAGAVR